MTYSLPLWATLAGQSFITVSVFIIFLVFSITQLEASIEDQVVARVQERIVTVQRTLAEPFVEGFFALESLTTISSAAPARFIPTDNESLAGDADFYRYSGSVMQSGKHLMYVAQIYESDSGPVHPLDGLPIPTFQITTKGSDTKNYGGREVLFATQAYLVNDTVYANQPKISAPTYTTSANALVGARMNIPLKRLWFNFPILSIRYDQETIINATTGLPQLITVSRNVLTQMAIYTTAVDISKFGKRYRLKWVQMMSVNLSSVQPLLLSLTDNAKGEKDSYAALYDLANPQSYTIMAVSHPDEVMVVNLTSQSYLPATKSSNAKLNTWFADALALSKASGVEEGSVRTADGRFLSYAHIRHQASNLHLFAVVSTAEHKYFAEVRRLQAVMVTIGVCCGALVVGLGLLIIYFVSVPIRGLKQGMGLAATLQNELVVPTRSFLSEVNSLCVAFEKMNTMLTQAKAYMPASMLVRFSSTDDDTGAEEEEEEEVGADAPHDMHPNSSMSTASVMSHIQKRSTDGTTITTHQTILGGKHVNTNEHLQTSLRNRRVAVLVVNVRGFTALADFAINTIAGHSTTMLDLITVAVSGERGVIDSFHGDHFVISFNAIKPVGSSGRRAVQCAAAIHQALAGTLYERVSMGASCGPAVVGSLGNLTQRRLSIIGGCYTKALRLQRAAASLERSVEPLFGGADRAPANCFYCLIDAATQAECTEIYNSMLIGTSNVVNGANRRDKHSPSVSVVEAQPTGLRQQQLIYAAILSEGSVPVKAKKDGDEWMYEMQHKTLKNPYRCLTEALEGALTQGSTAALNAARDRLKQLILESQHGGDAPMTSILPLVVSQLEQCVGEKGVATINRPVRFHHPSELKIDFASVEGSVFGSSVLAPMCPKQSPRISSKVSSPIVILDDPNASSFHQVLSSVSSTEIMAPRGDKIDCAIASKTELSELAGWLRLAYVASLVRGGSEIDLASAFMLA